MNFTFIKARGNDLQGINEASLSLTVLLQSGG